MTPLRDLQRRGLERIERQTATMLPFPMGSGKTRVIVEFMRKHDLRRTLIACPLSVIPVWPAEIGKYAPDMSRHVWTSHGRGSVARKKEELEKVACAWKRLIAVVHYDICWREPLASWILAQSWDLVVADESHRLKAPGGKASRFFARLRERAQKRVCLTGTPMPHDPLDAYGQYRFLDPTIYGSSFAAMRAKYCILGGHHVNGRPVQIVGWRALDEHSERFYRLAERVLESDIIQLPESQHIELPVWLSPETQRIYTALEEELIADVGRGVVTAANALVRVLRLQQLTSGHIALTTEEEETERTTIERVDEAKARALEDFLDGIDPSEPCVVFCRFRFSLDDARRVAEAAGRRVYEISGDRKDVAARWTPEPGGVCVAQYQSGSLGIDLTAARYCVLYDQTHAMGDYDQAVARVHRPGQHRHVLYYHLLAKGTIDYAIHRALEKKRDVITEILDHLKGSQHDRRHAETA
jgi:SNF2 family DNA or RNA helicase